VKRAGLLAWLGVILPPWAWAAQHAFGWGAGTAACPDHRTGAGLDVPVDGVTLALGAVAVAFILAGGAASFVAWRATRENDDSDPAPAGRIHFLSVIGMTIVPLFLAITIMSTVGAVVFNCTQS
jgi:hypothetical protein